MPTPAVIEKVRQLKAELGETRPTAATQPTIDSLKQHVDQLLDQPDHLPHYTSLNDRLLFAYVGFRVDHPKLAGVMEGVMASLSAAGI